MIFPFTIPGAGALALHAALALQGTPVVTQGYGCDNPNQIGGFHTITREIIVCEGNLQYHDVRFNEVVRHEAIHALHGNLGYHEGRPTDRTVLPVPVLGFFVRNTLSDQEIETVLLGYDSRILYQEFEARVGQRLPAGVIATGLVASQIVGVF